MVTLLITSVFIFGLVAIAIYFWQKAANTAQPVELPLPPQPAGLFSDFKPVELPTPTDDPKQAIIENATKGDKNALDQAHALNDATLYEEVLNSFLAQIDSELMETGVAGDDRAFNLTWHDWLNLRSLCETSAVIARAALARENSRGAHYRSDFPDPGGLAASRFTVARQTASGLEISERPVEFTIVKPGETLLAGKAAAE